jgi:twitching motility protein PilT
MSIEMSEILELAVQEGASDVHLTVGRPPILRIHGALEDL